MNLPFFAEPPNQLAGSEGQDRSPRVGELMTRPPLAVRVDATLAEVARLLLESGSGAALVVDKQGHLRGIISEADFTSREHCVHATTERAKHVLEEWQARGAVKELCATASQRHVTDLMSRYVPTAREDELVANVISRMIHLDIAYLPVERAGKLVGMLARRDVLRLIARQPTVSPVSDNPPSREG